MERDFEPVCTANSIEEADIIVAWFEREGFEAHVKDRNTVGTLTWGTPAIAPRGIEIVVPPDDAVRAREHWMDHGQSVHQPPPGQGGVVDAVCEECGKSSSYPYAMRGRVESCPDCGAYVDVPGDDDGAIQDD